MNELSNIVHQRFKYNVYALFISMQVQYIWSNKKNISVQP